MTNYRTITAKYPSTCPDCNEAIEAGEKVVWKKGSKARHSAIGACKASGVRARYERGDVVEYDEAIHGDYGNFCEAQLAMIQGGGEDPSGLLDAPARNIPREDTSLHLIVSRLPIEEQEKALEIATKALEAAGIDVSYSKAAYHAIGEAPVLYFP